MRAGFDSRRPEVIDRIIITFCRKWAAPFARFALFVIYFWFGILKIFDASPANPLVSDLMERTMPFMTFDLFILLFGIFEMLIGILFLVPRLWRVAVALLALHMITTFMPLIMVPTATWQGFFVPTLEGQYIIKNLLIITAAIVIMSRIPQADETLEEGKI